MSHRAPEKIVELRCTPPLSLPKATPRKFLDVVAPSLRSRSAHSRGDFVRHRLPPSRPAFGSSIDMPAASTAMALPK